MTRVLFFAPRDCRPPNTGTKLRNYHLCRELSRQAEVIYLSFADGEPDECDGESDAMAVRFITVPREKLGLPQRALQLARGLSGPWPLTVLQYTAPAMHGELGALLGAEKFDVVVMQSLILTAYLPLFEVLPARPKLICDWHNVDSEVLERYAAHAPGLPRKIYAQATAKRLARLEKSQMPRFDAHLTVSERDTAQVRQISPTARIWTLENGTETAGFAQGEAGGAQVRRYADRRQNRDRRQRQIPLPHGQIDRRERERRQLNRREASFPHRILFVGSMDYQPNIQAATGFARQIWPQIHEKHPEWVFTVVGRDPSPAVCELAELPGIQVTGTVPDVRPFYREAVAAVVPLRVGGGSRLKILEAMAARVPVVSTTLGAEGLGVEDGATIFIADGAEQMAQTLFDLVENREGTAKLVERAHELVMARYDWSAIGAQFRGICEELLGEKMSSEEVES